MCVRPGAWSVKAWRTFRSKKKSVCLLLDVYDLLACVLLVVLYIQEDVALHVG